jgi:hypothetical protein
MHRSEERFLGQCADCGEEIRPGHDPAFTFGTDGVLCAKCATRRGGRYDAVHDHWVREPDYGDLSQGFE